MNDLIDKIETSGFSCNAGPLEMSDDWKKLKEKLNLFVIQKRGKLIQHTLGKGGWGYSVFTNKEEAQAMADSWNRERYGKAKVCTVLRFGSEVPF